TRSRSPLRRLAPIAWLVRGAHSRRGPSASPSRFPDTRARSPRRRLAPIAGLVRGAYSRRGPSTSPLRLPDTRARSPRHASLFEPFAAHSRSGSDRGALIEDQPVESQLV